jgi:hypothetical protein
MSKNVKCRRKNAYTDTDGYESCHDEPHKEQHDYCYENKQAYQHKYTV